MVPIISAISGHRAPRVVEIKPNRPARVIGILTILVELAIYSFFEMPDYHAGHRTHDYHANY